MAKAVKSPFLVLNNIITVEQIQKINKRVKWNDDCATNKQLFVEFLQQSLGEEIAGILDHYNIKSEKQTLPTFNKIDTGQQVEPHAENAVYVRQNWLQVQPYAITCVLFLNSTISDDTVDVEDGVYEGKLEFPQYGFGFNAQAGTMITFPSTTHFINNIPTIKIGSMKYVKFHIITTEPFLYDPEQYPGNYLEWFKP